MAGILPACALASCTQPALGRASLGRLASAAAVETNASPAQGGRDTLGWVRSLVQFTEAQPFMDPAAAGAKPDGAAMAEGEG